MKPEETASFRGRETQVKALGQTWTVGRFTLDLLDSWLDWARPQLPDPIEVAEAAVLRLQRKVRAVRENPEMDSEEKVFQIGGLNDQIERTARLGMEKAANYLAINSPEVSGLMNSPRGAAQLFLLLLRKHHPDATPEQAVGIVSELGPQEMRRVMSASQGRAPAAKNAPAPPRRHR